MEQIFEVPNQFWSGLTVAALFLILRFIVRTVTSRNKNSPESASGNGRLFSTLSTSSIFLPDVVFALCYLMVGLQAALIFRLTFGFWSLVPRLSKGYMKSPALIWYAALTNIGLVGIVVSGSLYGLHLYGLVVFTFWYSVLLKFGRSKFESDEGGGSLSAIRYYGSSAIIYPLFIGLSGLVWTLGGVEYWIWFLILAKVLAIMATILAVVVLLPVLELLMRAIRRTAGPLG